MKIIAISDLHGLLPDYSHLQGDLVCIAGDISPLKMQRNFPQMKKWYLETFIPWCNRLNCESVVWVPGNHDLAVEDDPGWFIEQNGKESKVTMLLDSSYVFKHNGKHYNIYGTPWCKEFYNWAFMLPQEELKEKFSAIPSDLDILLTHDVPYGYADIVEQPTQWNTYTSLGSPALRDAILEKQPKVHISGHLHSTTHLETPIENTRHFNAAVLDEYYELTYTPQIINIDE